MSSAWGGEHQWEGTRGTEQAAQRQAQVRHSVQQFAGDHVITTGRFTPEQRRHQQHSQHQRLQQLLALHQQRRLPRGDARLLQLLLHQQAAQQGRLTAAGMQQLQVLEQQEAAQQQVQQQQAQQQAQQHQQRAQQQAQQRQMQVQHQHQQQAQQQAQMRVQQQQHQRQWQQQPQQQRQGMPIALAAAPAATSAVTATRTTQGGAQQLNDSMGVMNSLVSQLASANPVPQDQAIVKPHQLRQRMEQLRARRDGAVERTMRRQTQLEHEFFAHKLAIQDALQKELAELENESRKAEAQLEWHAKNGAIALMATGGAAVASAVVEAASQAPPALAAPAAAASLANPAAAPTAPTEAAGAGEALPSDQLVSVPVFAPHLAAVGSVHLASAMPPPGAAAKPGVAATQVATAALEIRPAPRAAGISAAAAAAAASVASPPRTATQALPSEPPPVQSPGLPPRPPASARRQRSGPVARPDDSLDVSPAAALQSATATAGHEDAMAVPILHQQDQPQLQPTGTPGAAALAAGRGQRRRQQAAGADHAASGSGAMASRGRRMDLLASAAVSGAPSTQQQPAWPSQAVALSPNGAAAALLSLQPGPSVQTAAAEEQPSAAPGPATAHPSAEPMVVGESGITLAGSNAAADPAADAQHTAARSSLPAHSDATDPAAAGSPAEKDSEPTVIDLDADSGATAPSADHSGSWHVDVGDPLAVELEDASKPVGQARSSDHSSQGSGSRKRKAAGGVGTAGPPQHAETSLTADQPSGEGGARELQPPAAEDRQLAAAQWTAVETTWHLLPGRDKPARVKDVNAIARETDDQGVAATITQHADARQRLAVQPDLPEPAAGAHGGGPASVHSSRQHSRASASPMPADQPAHDSTAGQVRTVRGQSALSRGHAAVVRTQPGSSPSASGGSTAPDAAGRVPAGGSRKRRRPARGSPLAAGAQSGDETGVAPRKRRRRGVKRLSQLARTAAAAEPSSSEQRASGLDLQDEARQSSHRQFPENAATPLSTPHGAAADASPGADSPSPRQRRAAAEQSAAVTQAMLQPLKPAAKPAAKPGVKPGHAGAASKRSPSSKPAADGAAAHLAAPAAAAKAPDADEGAAAPAANSAAGTDPAATDSKPGDSFYVFRLPRVRPKAGGWQFPVSIFTAAGLEPPPGTAPSHAAKSPGSNAAGSGAQGDASGSLPPGDRPLQQMHTNLPDLKWHLNRQAIISRAWNDRDNVTRRIPKTWDEALAHPTLRSLTLRSSRRYSVRSIVGLRGGAGPAWLLHKLLAEFGIDRKVNGVRRAAPRQQWLPAWRSARLQQPKPQASEQPSQQPSQQPKQHQQQQQPQPAHGAAAPPIGSQQRPPEQERSERSPNTREDTVAPQNDEDAAAPAAAAPVPANASADAVPGAPDMPAAANLHGEGGVIQPEDSAGAAAEHGVLPLQQDPAPDAMPLATSAGGAAADGMADADQMLLQPHQLSGDSVPGLPDAAGDVIGAAQLPVASSSAQVDDIIADAPPIMPSHSQPQLHQHQQQQQQQLGADAAREHAPVAAVNQDAMAMEPACQQQLPDAAEGLLRPPTAARPSRPDADNVDDDGAVAMATAATLAAVVDAVAEAAQPAGRSVMSTAVAEATAATLAAAVDAVAEVAQPADPGVVSMPVAEATAATLAAVVDAVVEAVQPSDAAAASASDVTADRPGLPPAEAEAAGQQMDSGQAALTPAEHTEQASGIAAGPAAIPRPTQAAAEPAAELSVLATLQAHSTAEPDSGGTAGLSEHLPESMPAGMLPRVPPLDADAIAKAAATPATGSGDTPVAVQGKAVAKVHPSKALIPWPQQLY